MGGYGDYIAQIIEGFPYNQLFSTDMVFKQLCEQFNMPLQQAKAITNNKLKRMSDAGLIERVQKGIYYRPQQTVFGPLRLTPENFMIQLLTKQDDEVIGYETGAAFMNQIGLTSLLPREIEVATNHFRKKQPEHCKVQIRKPVTTVSTDNFRYLQLLDAVDNLAVAHVDAPNAGNLIRAFADKQGLDHLRLIYTARQYYSAKTAIRTVDILMGER